MNKSLLAFAIVMIFAGISLGVNAIILLGIVLMIPALLTTPKPPTRVPVSRTQQPQPRRAPPPSMPQTARTEYSPAVSAQPQAPVSIPVPASTPSISPMTTSTGAAFAPPLFPTAIFPTLSLPSTYRPLAQQVPERKETASAQRDELIEFGVILAVVKLAFG